MNVQEVKITEEKDPVAAESRRFVARQYIEIPPRNVQAPTDALKQLAANVSSLESLHSQLSFMIREIHGLNVRRNSNRTGTKA